MKRRQSNAGWIGAGALVLLAAGWTGAVVVTHKPMTGLSALAPSSSKGTTRKQPATSRPDETAQVAGTRPADTNPSTDAPAAPASEEKPAGDDKSPPSFKIPQIPRFPSFGQ